eukprot:TRINITY_DN31598_c0_g1_i1.p1 TRINITY_DN31598_c0_g1~~TRINITY_DN31598_c0_g1_i1.p1  ORF type:complete len:389 (-),score=101.39 TRINITY_DN31598_c0_g1_i1:70-1236(-)
MGAERLGKPTILAVGETLALRVGVDAWPTDGSIACSFFVLRIDLCQPLAVDVVASPEGTTDEAIKVFVEQRLAEESLDQRAALDATAMPAQQAAPRNQVSGGSSSPNDAVQSGWTAEAPCAEQTAVPAALAAYLGEAPSAAAVRGGIHKAQLQDPSSFTPPDSPESSGGRAVRAAAGLPVDFDERPPTPTPDGFQDVATTKPHKSENSHVQPERRVVPAESQAAAATRAAAARAQGILLRDSPGTALAAPEASAGPEKTLGPDPAAALASFLGEAPSASALRAEHRPQEDLPSSSVAQSTLPPRPPGYEDQDIFYLEGAGWCDAYGRTIDSQGQGGAPPVKAPDKTTAAHKRSAGSKAAAASHRPAVATPEKLTAAQQQAAWDAIPGI